MVSAVVLTVDCTEAFRFSMVSIVMSISESTVAPIALDLCHGGGTGVVVLFDGIGKLIHGIRTAILLDSIGTAILLL